MTQRRLPPPLTCAVAHRSRSNTHLRSLSISFRYRSSQRNRSRNRWRGDGKTLTALGSYWKGRKPLILAKACVLGCLLPATHDPKRDLEIFEMLMGMDRSLLRSPRQAQTQTKGDHCQLSLARIEDYFEVAPEGALPHSAPVDWSNPAHENTVNVAWRLRSPRSASAGVSRRTCSPRPLPRARQAQPPPRGSSSTSTTTSGRR